MSLLQVVFWLIVIGVALYCFNRWVTFIDANIKKIINVVVIIVVLLWLCNVFGLFALLSNGPKANQLPRSR
jgi:hypothetical protein